MRPVLPGTRGPGVEDIQRRLLKLGYDLGSTGVDGVYLGKTRDAVTAFQQQSELEPDGVVGDTTWAALVDATFSLGDRMLYLRMPYFHGRDVTTLQTALNVLGFPTGAPDGIFGRFTERAVREFQRNCGHTEDGIVGPETVRTVSGLRHVWEDKDPALPSDLVPSAVRTADVLRRVSVQASGVDPRAQDVAERFVNLAVASDESAQVSLASDRDGESDVILVLASEAAGEPGTPTVSLGDDAATALDARLITALAAVSGDCRRIEIDLERRVDTEHACQSAAVRLLDAVCSALA